jgi:hypothetical protein
MEDANRRMAPGTNQGRRNQLRYFRNAAASIPRIARFYALPHRRGLVLDILTLILVGVPTWIIAGWLGYLVMEKTWNSNLPYEQRLLMVREETGGGIEGKILMWIGAGMSAIGLIVWMMQ